MAKDGLAPVRLHTRAVSSGPKRIAVDADGDFVQSTRDNFGGVGGLESRKASQRAFVLERFFDQREYEPVLSDFEALYRDAGKGEGVGTALELPRDLQGPAAEDHDRLLFIGPGA